MNRSILWASKRLPRLMPTTTKMQRSHFHSNNSNNSSKHYFTQHAFWVSAAGTCVFFQAYENYVFHNHATTMAEGRDEDENNGDKPWYRRYPTLNLNRISPQSYLKKALDPDGKSINTEAAAAKPPPKDNQTLFYGQCLQRQVYQPKVPYPAWDFNWDGRMLDNFSTLEVLSTAEGLTKSHSTGTTRHILLIRHGQYEEKHYDDRKRVLTPIGRRQAQLTGKRLAQMVENIGAAKVNAIYTSDLVRAKQTAWIIAKALPDSIPIQNPDPDLNEGLPASIVPPRPDLVGLEDEVDENRERMERAFRKYFFRADPPPELQKALQQVAANPEDDYTISPSGTVWPRRKTTAPQKPALPKPNHEFDIIVCHGNIIRYLACRALQLPPEAWLRLSVFNCSITYLMIKPNGYVSCRMIGDIGHLGYKETTFSGAHGLVWS